MTLYRQINCISVIRDGAEALFQLVYNRRTIDNYDITCFTGSEWGVVPWKKMEQYLGQV
jgi:hypothetical protein